MGGGKKKGSSRQPVSRELQHKDDLQEYAKVIKMLGDRRTTIVLPDGKETLGVIPGRFRKGRRNRFVPGDVVLVSYREFQDSRCDIIVKYTDGEARELLKRREIPEFFLDGLATDPTKGGGGIIFGEEDEEEAKFDFDEI